MKIEVPASKSISNRLLILQKTSGISFTINNLSTAEDTKLLADLLEIVAYARNDEWTTINCENCGTAYRFLTAFLACKSGKWILDGSERMRERPIKGLVDALQKAGADIVYLGKNGFPPLKINGKPLNTNTLVVDSTQSSQYVSALAMILPLLPPPLSPPEGGKSPLLWRGWGRCYARNDECDENTKKIQLQFSTDGNSLQYIDMTIKLMQDLGLDIARNENVISYHHTETTKNPIDFFVEYDWSSAAVWFELAALIPKGNIFIEGLQKSELQADTIIAEWVKTFGVKTIYQKEGVLLKKTHHKIPESFTADCKNNLDLVPYIAVLCAALGVKTCLQNIENLTFKESNRIGALVQELGKIAFLEYKDNALLIEPNGKQLPDSVCFSSHSDHRIAMSLAVLSALIPQVKIDNMSCVKKSYPGFSKQYSPTLLVKEMC